MVGYIIILKVIIIKPKSRILEPYAPECHHCTHRSKHPIYRAACISAKLRDSAWLKNPCTQYIKQYTHCSYRDKCYKYRNSVITSYHIRNKQSEQTSEASYRSEKYRSDIKQRQKLKLDFVWLVISHALKKQYNKQRKKTDASHNSKISHVILINKRHCVIIFIYNILKWRTSMWLQRNKQLGYLKRICLNTVKSTHESVLIGSIRPYVEHIRYKRPHHKSGHKNYKR